jgi:2-methylcitrate dehydratase PrpD
MHNDLSDLLHWLFDTDPLGIPEAEQRARLLLLDTLGCYIAGQNKPAVAAIAQRFAALDAGPIRLPGLTSPVSTLAATFLLATGACWDEACEGLARAHGRPGLHALPPAIAISLNNGLSLGAALRSLVTGYEVGGRMGEALRIRAGMHVDGSWGALGAAAASARALGGDAKACATAVETVACQIPFSLYAPVAEGKTARNTYPGHGATLGLLAGISALSGVDSPANALEDYFRFALDGGPDLPTLTPPGKLLTLEGYLKPHAAVRHVHYGAECALLWREQHGTDTRAIESVTLKIYDEAQRYCGNRAPKTAIQAQFSLTHGLARTLVAGDLGPETYTDDAMKDSEVIRLEALTNLKTDDALTEAEQRGATLTIEQGGEQTNVSVSSILGDPGKPFGEDAVRAKFLRYASPIIGVEKAKAITETILLASEDTPLSDVLAPV